MLYLLLEGTLLKQVSLESESKERVKKLVSVSAISMPVTGTREEAVETVEAVETAKISKDGEKSEGEYPNLAQVPCIRYPITFWKKSMSMLALFDLGSEVNAIYPTLAWELGLLIRPTNVGVQKIDGNMLDTFGMVATAFSVMDKTNQVKFFEETFLMANVSLEVVFGMSFPTLGDADIDFLSRKLR